MFNIICEALRIIERPELAQCVTHARKGLLIGRQRFKPFGQCLHRLPRFIAKDGGLLPQLAVARKLKRIGEDYWNSASGDRLPQSNGIWPRPGRTKRKDAIAKPLHKLLTRSVIDECFGSVCVAQDLMAVNDFVVMPIIPANHAPQGMIRQFLKDIGARLRQIKILRFCADKRKQQRTFALILNNFFVGALNRI